MGGMGAQERWANDFLENHEAPYKRSRLGLA